MKPMASFDQARLLFQSFQFSNDAVMVSDNEGLIQFVNPAFTRLYGYAEPDVLGKPTSILRHPLTKKGVFKQMWADIRNQKKGYWRGEVKNRCKNGNSVDVLLTITAVRDETGEPLAFTSIALDLTERTLLGKRLAQQEKLSSIGLLASGMAHEIGSPLNVISGRAEMVKTFVKDCGKDHENAQKSLDIIISQTERIGDLVKGLLNFSRPGEAAPVSDYTEIDIAQVIEEAYKLLRQSMKGAGVDFSVDDQTTGKVNWVFNKCEQVFVNLIQNAIHALHDLKNPSLHITLQDAHTDDLEVLEISAKAGLRVDVADNGCGIPQDYLNRVFDPFFTTKEVGTGTGLGLSVVYGLVREIQGELTVKSQVGQGTTFTLIFPIL